MAHTLLEQEWIAVYNASNAPKTFLQNKIGLTFDNMNKAVLNTNGGIGFNAITANTAGNVSAFNFKSKNNDDINIVQIYLVPGSILYHISEGESVKYFKYVQDDAAAENSYTYILAQDVDGEWVVFNGDKMYSEYGATGIYNNPQIGRAEIVDEENQFLISKAHRLDTGAEFKELYFVLSAKSYSDTNCIVDFGGKTYRLVSVSNTKDETGRYPAFAFPVSD